MEKLKLGILGSGYLGGIIANAWKDGLLPEYELVGIAGRNMDITNKLAKEMGCKGVATADELIAMKPDYIAEAASGDAVREFSIKALENGINIAILSIGAYADADFYERVKTAASENNAKVYIASGAIGGFDVLRTVALMGQAKTNFDTCKGPKSLRNTPVFEEKIMTEKTKVFDGSAKEIIAMLPTKVNVAVAASLASVGPDNTDVTMTTIPDYIGDDHRITEEIEGVKAVIDVYSSTSAIAGWSVVALLQNIVSPIVF